MEYILNNCILALLDSPGSTLLGINRLLVDKEYRKKIVSKIKDPVVKAFWVEEYANYNERFRTEAIAPIQNKVGQFLSSSVIRNIVGQSKSTIDMREIMDNRKILILNLSKGRIGEDNSALLGAMMITKIQLAAMSRVDIPEAERKDFYLYVDEFQNFATESFADILSEARKYRLNLIMAHQYIAQLTSMAGGGRVTKVKDAVFGNVGTLICFRIGAPDAEELIKEFEPYFVEEDLVNITKYQIYLKLMIDGVASKPFSAKTLPPTKTDEKGIREKVVAVSRERYANSKAEVEEKIMRWSGLEETMGSTAKEARMDGDEAIFKSNYIAKAPVFREADDQTESSEDESSGKGKVTAICDNCGKAVNIKFQPDNKRNVFCKECLKKFKAGEIDASKIAKKNVLPEKEEKKDDIIYPQLIKKPDLADQANTQNHYSTEGLAPGQVVSLEEK
jgi:CxxC-x17-CxxC domain-containing protein